jgi:20S proteasome alpha/beta subunit
MPILAGLETEYGLQVEGSGPEEQVAHARALVECHGGPCHVGWDYRDESPRNDLRGFQLKKLAQDLADAVFDRSAERLPAAVERADRVLPNGARLYNDHGHPEYATPECWTLRELALHDAAGELVVGAAARAYEEKLGRRVRVFKNNTDGHGASYGTHESYLAPRSFGFARLYRSVTPVLAVRSLLTGAGKAGAESGPPCRFQSSQRADFLVEPANAETLARRPVFNTRDEPHADPAEWIRMHVIAGDASMSPATTVRKVGLVKIALRLEELGECPSWALDSPPRAMAETSRCLDGTNRIMLEGGSWTTPAEILRSYAEAALAVLDPRDRYDAELRAVAEECLELLGRAAQRDEPFSRAVDWACKLGMIESFFAAEGQGWDAEARPSPRTTRPPGRAPPPCSSPPGRSPAPSRSPASPTGSRQHLGAGSRCILRRACASSDSTRAGATATPSPPPRTQTPSPSPWSQRHELRRAETGPAPLTRGAPDRRSRPARPRSGPTVPVGRAAPTDAQGRPRPSEALPATVGRMTFAGQATFESLRPSWPNPPGPEAVHGTTVLALRHRDGATVIADRRATMGSLIMYDRAEKIVPIDPTVVLAVSGAYGRSLEACRYLRHALKYYERLNRVTLSTEAKLSEVSRTLSQNLPAAMEGSGLFLPIAATYDPPRKAFAVHFFDAAGARFDGGSYACAGSGSERIRGVFEYLERNVGPWDEREANDALTEGLRLLELAADMDSATGGLRKALPSAYRLTTKGAERVGDAELAEAAEKAAQGRG